MIEAFGGIIHRSPSDLTSVGREFLKDPKNLSGSLGIAISEAVEVAAMDPNTRYALGSVLNHVLLHQTVIGQETQLQLEMADVEPDILVGCTGGGSNHRTRGRGMGCPAWVDLDRRSGCSAKPPPRYEHSVSDSPGHGG
jgi:predicted alternative tryptophan synthase beta-subunit